MITIKFVTLKIYTKNNKGSQTIIHTTDNLEKE